MTSTTIDAIIGPPKKMYISMTQREHHWNTILNGEKPTRRWENRLAAIPETVKTNVKKYPKRTIAKHTTLAKAITARLQDHILSL